MSLQSLGTTVAAYWQRVQTTLFPFLETAGLPLTPELKRLVAILDLLRIEEALPPRRASQVGAPPKDRAPLARAFLVKQYLNLPGTKALRERLRTDDTLRRICGWATAQALPSEATFSRAFAVFADLGLADLVHADRVRAWLGDTLVWHQALDATDIAGREAPHPNPEPQYGRTASGKRRKHPKSDRPPGRPKKGEVVEPPLTRMERQLAQVPEIALLEIPTACDTGAKPDVHQHLHYWVGYKFHVITNEWGIPLCAVTTAASVHDSQVAIPLLQLTARRVTALYDLMDRGYDAAAIRTCSQALGHVPLIPAVPPPDAPPPEVEADRMRLYKGRTVAERFNARLKDEAGGKQIRVRGHRKVHAHLMFGLLVIFADALLRLAG
jgi:IS5 family transposase